MMDKDAQSVTQEDDMREIVAALREGQQTNDQYGEVMIRAANMLEHLASQPTSAEDAGEQLTLKDVEAQTIALMKVASSREGMKINDWVADRMLKAAERALSSRPTPDAGTAAIGAEAMREALRYAFETGADTKASYEQGNGDRRWSAELDDEFEMFMRNYPALSQPVAAPQAEDADANCERCQGNGEIVTDWERYLHAHDGDVGDEAVTDCPDCDGTGHVDLSTPPQPEGGTVTKWPSTCDGIEQDAFEEWAKGERMVMDTHPIHWLFLNAETAAARKGWKAGLLHAANRLAALTPEKSK